MFDNVTVREVENPYPDEDMSWVNYVVVRTSSMVTVIGPAQDYCRALLAHELGTIDPTRLTVDNPGDLWKNPLNPTVHGYIVSSETDTWLAISNMANALIGATPEQAAQVSTILNSYWK